MTNPLFRSVFHELTRSGVRRAESYSTTAINPNDVDSASDAVLEAAGFPKRGDPHPGNPNIVVTEVRISRESPATARLDYIYDRPENDIFPQNTDELGFADVAFSAIPFGPTALIATAFVSPVNTKTVELDPDTNLPTTDPPTIINTVLPTFERQTDTLVLRAHRITFTVTGTAGQLGIGGEFGDVGLVPVLTQLTDTIHTIGLFALLFNGVDLSWTGNRPDGRVYTINYEWTYEPGQLTVLPDGWSQDPEIGPVGGLIPILGSIGRISTDSDGNKLYGVATPSVSVPPDIAGRGHIQGGGVRYAAPPYCDARSNVDASGDFAVPFFESIPRYVRVDANEEWRNFPGIGVP